MNDKQILSALNSLEQIAEGLCSESYCNDDPVALAKQVEMLSRGAHRIASAIHPVDGEGAQDASGTYVCSLTEAIGGMTAGLCKIADAIEHLAESVERIKK